MGQKNGTRLIWVNKHPQGKVIVNIDHIVKIEIATNHVTIKLSSGTDVIAEYTEETINDLLAIM